MQSYGTTETECSGNAVPKARPNAVGLYYQMTDQIVSWYQRWSQMWGMQYQSETKCGTESKTKCGHIAIQKMRPNVVTIRSKCEEFSQRPNHVKHQILVLNFSKNFLTLTHCASTPTPLESSFSPSQFWLTTEFFSSSRVFQRLKTEITSI